jgi:p-aminobenzoyl-glutamate transporter AbgT
MEMEINWYMIGSVIIITIVLVIFLIMRNLKDKKNYEKYLKKNDKSISIKDEIESNEL